MIIQLIDSNKQMCTAWKSQFKGCKDVHVFHGDLFENTIFNFGTHNESADDTAERFGQCFSCLESHFLIVKTKPP